MKVRYLGHSCFELIIDGQAILVDPFISGNPLVGNKVDVQELNPDFVFLTHGHEDHVLDCEVILKQSGATLVAAYEICNWFGEKGCDKSLPMNIGGKYQFDFGKIRTVQAVHSSVMPDGSYGANPMGFVFETKEGNVYMAGDTALTYDMKLIPLICGTLDLAVLPIGGHFAMDAEDAVIAADFVQCKRIVGCHYDTFGYIEINHAEVRSLFEKSDLEIILPTIGQEISIEKHG